MLDDTFIDEQIQSTGSTDTPTGWNSTLTWLTQLGKSAVCLVVKTGPVPKHIAIIMDGNRRFAKQNNMELRDGHTAGAITLAHALHTSFRFGINTVTVYAFSIENFNRPKTEIDTLFDLLRERLQSLNEANLAGEEKVVRIRIIGNRAMIPSDLLEALERIEVATQDGYSHTLNVCFPYTSRDDITASIQAVLGKIKLGDLSIDEVDQQVLCDNMYFGAHSPPVDILIRTSGHTRLSDFMLWQSTHNATIEFVDVLWPSFNFLSITKVILKWSYYKTLWLEDTAVVSRKPKAVILAEMRDAPALVSITGR